MNAAGGASASNTAVVMPMEAMLQRISEEQANKTKLLLSDLNAKTRKSRQRKPIMVVNGSSSASSSVSHHLMPRTVLPKLDGLLVTPATTAATTTPVFVKPNESIGRTHSPRSSDPQTTTTTTATTTKNIVFSSGPVAAIARQIVNNNNNNNSSSSSSNAASVPIRTTSTVVSSKSANAPPSTSHSAITPQVVVEHSSASSSSSSSSSSMAALLGQSGSSLTLTQQQQQQQQHMQTTTSSTHRQLLTSSFNQYSNIIPKILNTLSSGGGGGGGGGAEATCSTQNFDAVNDNNGRRVDLDDNDNDDDDEMVSSSCVNVTSPHGLTNMSLLDLSINNSDSLFASACANNINTRQTPVASLQLNSAASVADNAAYKPQQQQAALAADTSSMTSYNLSNVFGLLSGALTPTTTSNSGATTSKRLTQSHEGSLLFHLS